MTKYHQSHVVAGYDNEMGLNTKISILINFMLLMAILLKQK